jgi:hypothetical protein
VRCCGSVRVHANDWYAHAASARWGARAQVSSWALVDWTNTTRSSSAVGTRGCRSAGAGASRQTMWHRKSLWLSSSSLGSASRAVGSFPEHSWQRTDGRAGIRTEDTSSFALRQTRLITYSNSKLNSVR